MTAFRDIIQARQGQPKGQPQGQPPGGPGPGQRQRAAARPLAAPWRPMRQRQADRWALTAPPGQTLRGPHHRAMRLLVEALELARASGLSEAQMQALLSAAFIRDAGDPRRTAGGLGVALLMLCESLSIDADQAEVDELNRILALLDTQRSQRAAPAPAPAPVSTPASASAAGPRPGAGAPNARTERNKELHEDFGHQPH